MKMRMPALPLITVDPYFSVWSLDELNSDEKETFHWTGSPNAIHGRVKIDGEEFRFLGMGKNEKIKQINLDVDALTTKAVFANEKIELTASFTTPIIVTDLFYSSRPVSYCKLSYRSLDGKKHEVSAKISVSEELVLNKAGEGRALSEPFTAGEVCGIKMGNGEQKVLSRCGDDLRIDWGYFYLGVKGACESGAEVFDGKYAVYAESELKNDALFLFAYDDIDSILYFENPTKAYWKKDGMTICEAIETASEEYDTLIRRCDEFSSDLYNKALEYGGEAYAELLSGAYRQVMAAHKLILDEDGEVIYISKECFSNGCAATVDVTYPSAPMYLYYNIELLKGMLRPIFRYARSDEWNYDFAPHNAGKYPFVHRQYYGLDTQRMVLLDKMQMPVEECGNVIILISEICERENDCSFALKNMDLLEKWNEYLVKYGADPENQLCTDDFAGHLASNTNLAIKAIMGIVGFSRIKRRIGRPDEADRLFDIAKIYAETVLKRSENEDGSHSLVLDVPGTFSLKYNSVWDKIWKTSIFPKEFFDSEISRYKREALPYGVPLDSRAKYTKSDWEIWAACLSEKCSDFEFFAGLIHKAFDTMHTRVPMTDWYFADIAEKRGFQARSVQGGLFIKLLFD